MKPYRQQTYYELLGVPPNASAEEIRLAYTRITELPSTSCATRFEITEIAQLEDLRRLLLEALQHLSDLDRRTEYDRTLGIAPSGSNPGTEREAEPAQLTMPEILNVAPPSYPAPLALEFGPTLSAPVATEMATAHALQTDGLAPTDLGLRAPEVAGSPPAEAVAPTAQVAVHPVRPKPKGVPADAEFNGELLREIREGRGLTLQQVCERTRISLRHLENVEADRYDALPNTVYLRGIVMNLARELKLDPLRVARSYLGLVAAAKEKQK